MNGDAPSEEKPIERVLCCSIICDEEYSQEIFRHKIFSFDSSLTWPPENWRNIKCWHCVHDCPVQPVPVPHMHDRKRDIYHVFGVFCDWPCAKAFLLDQNVFSGGDRIMALEEMARTKFGYTGPHIQPATSKYRLDIFGGDLDIEAFRSPHTFSTPAMSPPLISAPEIYEKAQVSTGQMWSVKGIRCNNGAHPRVATTPAASSSAPANDEGDASIYNVFLSNKRSQPPREEPGEPVPGTLSAFMKKRR